jgi:NAD(P)H-dependent FMN reductase
VIADLPTLQVVVASTRAGRKGPIVATWFAEQARLHGKFRAEIADLGIIDLPMMDEPEHPRLRRYQHDHTNAWSARIERSHAFVFVTPEYNHGTPPSLLNALDYLVEEWAYKPVGFVSYGGVSGGLRGVQMTKQVVTALKMVPLVEAVAVPAFVKFIDATTGVFSPDEIHAKNAAKMLDELLRWSNALRVLRPPDSLS